MKARAALGPTQFSGNARQAGGVRTRSGGRDHHGLCQHAEQRRRVGRLRNGLLNGVGRSEEKAEGWANPVVRAASLRGQCMSPRLFLHSRVRPPITRRLLCVHSPILPSPPPSLHPPYTPPSHVGLRRPAAKGRPGQADRCRGGRGGGRKVIEEFFDHLVDSAFGREAARCGRRGREGYREEGGGQWVGTRSNRLLPSFRSISTTQRPWDWQGRRTLEGTR